MILPRLRANLDVTLSPVDDRPGLFIRDCFRYSDAQLIIPPPLIPGLRLFDGVHTELDLQQEIIRVLGSHEIGSVAENLVEALSGAGFLENETYATMKQQRLAAFVESPVLPAAHAGSAYPAQIGPLRTMMQGYLEGAASTQQRRRRRIEHVLRKRKANNCWLRIHTRQARLPSARFRVP